MKKDTLDRPLPSTPTRSRSEPLRPQGTRRELTDNQRELILQGAREGIQLARDIVEVLAIREQGAVTVRQIEAETDRIVAVVQADVARLKEEQNAVRERGQIAVAMLDRLIRGLEGIPEMDNASRLALLQAMPAIIESAVRRS